MLRAPFLCPLCEVRTLLPSRTAIAPSSQWHHQTRSLAHSAPLFAQMRRRPARMELSPKVSQRSPTARPSRQTTGTFTPHRPKQKAYRASPLNRGPFAGLNQTRARVPDSYAERQPPERLQFKQSRQGPIKNGRNPVKALKMQQALSAVSYGQRASIKKQMEEISSFQEFPLLPVVQESISSEVLPGLVDISPTPIQKVAIPTLIGSGDKRYRRQVQRNNSEGIQEFLLAAETGSGKTIAYLVPVIDAMKRAELLEKEQAEQAKADLEREEANNKKNKLFELDPPPLSSTADKNIARPRVIILVPTAALVSQVGAVAKAFSHTVKFKAAPISAALSPKIIRNRLFSANGVDMVISTPHLLSSIAESDPNILSRVTHIVIDEADSLFDRSFSPLTTSIIDKATPSLRQLIMCSATIPRSLDSFLRKRFPDTQRLVTPNLHTIPRRVPLGVVFVDKDPYHNDKDLACADTIWNIGRSSVEHIGGDKESQDSKYIIVFVNERETAVDVAKYLVTKGINAQAINRDTPGQKLSQMLATFKRTSNDNSTTANTDTTEQQSTIYSPPLNAPGVKWRLPNTQVIVTTDLGSRGIDTVACRHVILYDVPHTTIDFIHRLGRTGRMGRRGRGIVLVGKKDRRDIVKEVKESMFRGQALI